MLRQSIRIHIVMLVHRWARVKEVMKIFTTFQKNDYKLYQCLTIKLTHFYQKST